MKLNRIIFGGLTVATLALIAGCTSQPMDVTNREDYTYASIPQEHAGFDTFGRQWGETPATQTAVTPAPAEPAPAAAPTTPSTCSSEINLGLIHMRKTAPAQVALNETYESDITATAVACASDVIITDHIPAGASYVKSDPAGQLDGSKLVWNLGDMDAGQTVNLKVWLKADQKGSLVNCAVVSANPRTCTTTIVGQPTLAIEKTGPATAQLGADVTYNIVVRNTGNAVAKNVVVTDATPDGLSGQPLNVTVGDLAPGEAKTLTATFKADKRGKACDDAVATSDNTDKVDAQACTVVQQTGLKVTKTGTANQIIGRKADYQITVQNTGDVDLANVSVVDTAPDGTTLVAAPDAAVNGNTATWTVANLPAGGSQSYTATVVGKVAGSLCNQVTASGGGLSDSAQACTVWKGVAGVLLEMVDDPDPVQVGDSVTYTIKVTNQGFADIHNIGMVAQYGTQVDPVSSPDGTVNGKTVNFPNIPVLEPKKVATYTVIAKGVSPGDHRTRVTLTADELTSPVIKEESTTIY